MLFRAPGLYFPSALRVEVERPNSGSDLPGPFRRSFPNCPNFILSSLLTIYLSLLPHAGVYPPAYIYDIFMADEPLSESRLRQIFKVEKIEVKKGPAKSYGIIFSIDFSNTLLNYNKGRVSAHFNIYPHIDQPLRFSRNYFHRFQFCQLNDDSLIHENLVEPQRHSFNNINANDIFKLMSKGLFFALQAYYYPFSFPVITSEQKNFQ
jgi:hypothetical protein